MKWMVIAALVLGALGALVWSTESASMAQTEAQEPATEEGLEVFVPSEKLPAGSAVSFPVDI